MLTKQDMDRINSLPQDKMVLMAIVNTNPSSVDNSSSALATRIKSHAKDEAIPPTLLSRLLERVSADQREFGKSQIYVLGEDVEESIGVQLDLEERLHFGRPLRSVLMSVLEVHPRVGVLAVDREWGRFFVLEQGELTEMRREQNPDVGSGGDSQMTGRTRVPGANNGGETADGPQSSSGNDLFQNYLDASEQKFFNALQAELEPLMKENDLKYLALVGPDERRANFKAEIPTTARFEIIAETNVEVGPGHAPSQSLLEKIMPMVEEFKGVIAERLLEQVQEKGIMNLENVLEAVQEGRVYALLIPQDGAQLHLFRSHNPEVPYYSGKKDLTESPLDGSLMERVTLEEILPDLSDQYGLEIHRMTGDHGEKLVREYGGLAALVRY